MLYNFSLTCHLTYLLRNLYAGQEATVRVGLLEVELIGWLVQNWERSMSRLYIVTLLIYFICRVHHAKMQGWMTHKLESSLLGEISTTSDMQMISLTAESEDELKSLLMRVKEESEKSGLKFNIQKAKIMASNPISSWQIEGEKVEAVTNILFLGSKITADGDCSHEIKRCFWKKNYDQPRQHIKKQKHHFANKWPYSQSYGFSSSHVWMWELDYKESWALKNWCFWTVVLEKPLKSPLDCKEIQPVHPKGDQSWVFIGRTDVEAEIPILWPPDAKS